MESITQNAVLGALRGIVDQGSDIVSGGLVSGVNINDGKVSLVITVEAAEANKKSWLQAACEKAIRTLSGVKSVSVVMTAETNNSDQKTHRGNAEERYSDDPAGESRQSRDGGGAPPLKKAIWNTNPLAHVSRIIAVSSGKGGVGKSTTAVNLAHALHAMGKKVGLLDADIYGPSLPRMMGISKRPDIVDNKIIPLLAHGIACMSMGLLIDEKSAIIWRGPQTTKALHQMLRDVAWGTAENPMDVLLIDMPPGTGDVHLSLAQQVPVDGVVIVTTPQDVAVADALKSVDMFRKVNVPIMGVIENMSGFTDPATGKTHAIFGTGGGKRLAEATQSPFLGEIPIDISVREASDSGIRYQDNTGHYQSIALQLVK